MTPPKCCGGIEGPVYTQLWFMALVNHLSTDCMVTKKYSNGIMLWLLNHRDQFEWGSYESLLLKYKYQLLGFDLVFQKHLGLIDENKWYDCSICPNYTAVLKAPPDNLFTGRSSWFACRKHVAVRLRPIFILNCLYIHPVIICSPHMFQCLSITFLKSASFWSGFIALDDRALWTTSGAQMHNLHYAFESLPQIYPVIRRTKAFPKWGWGGMRRNEDCACQEFWDIQ